MNYVWFILFYIMPYDKPPHGLVVTLMLIDHGFRVRILVGFLPFKNTSVVFMKGAKREAIELDFLRGRRSNIRFGNS